MDGRALRRESKEILDQLGIEDIDINEKIASLPLAQRQLVEIAKALSHDLKVLVLDDPHGAAHERRHRTPVPDPQPRPGRQARPSSSSRTGSPEVLAFCNRGTILRNGKTVTTVQVAGVTEDELIEAMIGQKADAFYQAASHRGVASTVPALEVEKAEH